MGLAGGYGGALGQLWCFPAGTKVTMGDGVPKNIEAIRAGEMVMTENGEPAEVITAMEPHKNIVYVFNTENGMQLRTTLSQPVREENGAWIDAGDIVPGETRLKGAGLIISKRGDGTQRVYDLHVGGDNTYIADGFIVKGGDW